MDNNTPAPLSADSLRAIFEPLEKSGFPTDSVMKAIDAYTAAALQAERQRIADSLPEKRPVMEDAMWDFSDGMEGHMERAKLVENAGFNEAIEAVRAVLIPPPGGSPTFVDAPAQGHEAGNSSESAPEGGER